MENHNGFPGALPAIFSGLEAGQIDLVPGAGFWARIEQIAVRGEMTRGLDTAMHGRPSPRIWLFLHEPGRGELSAAVAMSFARELAFRDQAALVLDCDDQEQALTRWAGRLEAEGWIDLARYGTSVLTSGMPMPFVGRRGYLLGVGSFAPTDVTGKEVDVLLTRLRRQADDLLLVAPADSTGLLWAPASSIRVLCWDRQTLTADAAAEQARKFEEAGCPLTAVVTFQEAAAATEKLVDEVLAEVDAPEESAPVRDAEPDLESGEHVPPKGAVGAEPPAETEEDGTDTGAGGPDAGDDEPRWEDLPLEQGIAVGADGDDDDDPRREPAGWDQEFDLPLPEPTPPRDTSRIFWVGAVIALAVIAVASVYYFKYMRVPPEGHFEQIEIAAEPVAESPERAAAADSLDEAPAATPDSLAAAAAPGPGEVQADLTESRPDTSGQGAGAPATMPPATEVAEQDRAATTLAEVPATAAAVFDMAPYREPVGAKGWALHVFSFPDSAGTANQVGELDRRGFTSAIRIFDLGEKGRWRRVYLGSFSSRTEARQAMPALLKKLRVDWAKPEIFQTSAPE